MSYNARYIVQTMPCACLLFDDEGTIEYVNSFLCEAVGYEAEELIQQKLDRILTISSRLFYQTHFFPLLRLNGKVSEIFMTLRSRTGESVPVMINGTRDTSGDNAINLCICITVWERQKYESEILKSKKVLQKTLEDNAELNRLKHDQEFQQQKLDRQISQLIQRSQEYVQLNKVLSHDLQEPIRKIGFFCDMALNTAPEGTPELPTLLGKIQESVVRLRSLTNCLQQFVGVESNEEQPTSLNLQALIEEAKNDASQATSFYDFELELGRMPAVEGRASQIQLLFAELIKNAIQNRKEHTSLYIRIHPDILEENSYQFSEHKYHYTDHLRLEMTDNGTGFDNRYSTYIIGLFNKLKPESKGMGLGLALCKQIVSNHYGSISAKSNPNTGSTFIITLPLIQPDT